MRFIPGEDQQLIKEVYSRFFAQECPISLVRDCEGSGHSPDLWNKIVDSGLLRIGLDDGEKGAAGAVERALVAEEFGRTLAPVPLLESWIAIRCLSRASNSRAERTLGDVLSGKSLVSVAPRTAGAGGVQFVPAATIADGVLALTGTKLAYHPTHRMVSPGGGRLGAAASGMVQLGAPEFEIEVASAGTPAGVFAEALAEWRVLTAAALNGLGGRALEIARDYARLRTAFGHTIDTFQAVAHPLADVATRLEGSRLLTLEAAWALANELGEADALSSMAFVSAAQLATDLTRVAMHVHGGYGITEDYDIQLFYRRAKAWPLMISDPRAEGRRLGEKLQSMKDLGRPLPPWHFEAIAQHEGYDFALGPRHSEFRNRLIRFLDDCDPRPDDGHADSTAASEGFSPAFHKDLGRAGYIALGWPEQYGGKDTDELELTIFAQELSRKTGHHNSPLSTSKLVAQTIIAAGSDEQREKYLPAIARGDLIIALGYSEPSGGSDVAAARTRAVGDGDHWIINGQKMFTTSGDFADFVFLLTRTNTEKPKHRGLTMFLVPLKSRGIEVRPVTTIGGVRTTATFYSDVRVSDAQRVGEVDGGWDVLSVALKHEHGGQSYHWLTAKLLSEAMAAASLGLPDPASPIAERIAHAAIAIENSKLLAYRSAWLRANGVPFDGECGPMAKLYSSDTLVHATSELIDMLGSNAVAACAEMEDHAGAVHQAFLVAPGTTTYGGTVEVMRSLIAEHHLGLARSR